MSTVDNPTGGPAAAVLLAVIRGEDTEAVRLLDAMPQLGRAGLLAHLRRAADMADDWQRCPRCKGWASDAEAVLERLPDRRWHRACHTADLADRAAAGDRRARAILELRQGQERLRALAKERAGAGA